MKILSPKAALQALQNNNNCCLIDIREPYERLGCQIDCQAIPMAEFAAAYPSLRDKEQVILMCQSGKRAEALANFIETEYAAANIALLEGGLNAWIAANEPTLSCQ